MQLELEESHEFGYHTLDALSDTDTEKPTKNAEKSEINATGKAIPIQNDNISLGLPNEELQKLKQADTFIAILSPCYKIKVPR